MQIDNIRPEHLDEIVKLDKECYVEKALAERHIASMLNNINSNGFVFYDGKNEVIAYLIYFYNSQEFTMTLARMGVKKVYRRKGLATRLLNKLKDKIHATKPIIITNVSDSNLVGHLFLQSQGFVAKRILEEKKDDVYYEFIFRYQWKNDIFQEDEVLGV